ncbi:nuclease A inhibitor family protein [Eisenibacter elegans]|jgi:hypothetical protein|uniref:nuclease A inhibitor family protein n=1 Tax=Eisenibacter elegans TaxID=997 RepID=UPI00040FC5DC|nr:nuclease A inhibitor family protein [Eisenibacter elegans]
MSTQDPIDILLSRLEQASAGLLYPSESDYPFEAIYWEWDQDAPLSSESLREYLEEDEDTPISEIPLERFFRPVAEEKDWHSDEERLEVQQYQNLRKLLEQLLQDLRVFKVGDIEVDVFIVGKVPNTEDYAGLSTVVIET